MSSPTLLLNYCRWHSTTAGTGAFTIGAAAAADSAGLHDVPINCGAVIGGTYRYYAQSADGTQTEGGRGEYNGSTFSRTTVLFNSDGTTSPVNFTTDPIVDVIPNPSTSLIGGGVITGVPAKQVLAVPSHSNSAILYADGADFYVLLGDIYGNYNSLRPFYINMSNGSVVIDGSGAGTNFYGPVTVNGDEIVTGHLNIDGALNVGAVVSYTPGDISSVRSVNTATGIIFLGNSGSKYLWFDGTEYQMPGAYLITAAGRSWGTSDAGTLVQNTRLAYAGDYFGTPGSIVEPFSGAVVTGADGGNAFRMRYLQIQLNGGGWYTVGYA